METLNLLKKNDVVCLLMSRYNPQLSKPYYKITECLVEKVNIHTIKVADELYLKNDGSRKNESKASYGTTDYKIITLEEGIKLFEKYKSLGCNVSYNKI